MQSTLNQAGTDHLWRQLAPHLEAAMSRLNARERTLLALRFYESKTGAEAATLLGIREEAAHKRTARALEKLRKIFTKHGINSTTALLAGAISTNSVQAVPAGLAKAVTTVAAAKGAAAGGSTLTLSKGALKIMAWTKAKVAITAAAGLILATTVAVVFIEKESLVEGKTEAQWIKSIKYFGDDDQTKLWRSLGPQGVRMLTRAMKSPVYDHSTRMCVVSLISQLGNDVKSAIPEIINQIKTEKDDGVRQIELGYFEGPIQTMSENGKAALFPELLRAMQSQHSGVRNNALVTLQYYPPDTVIPIMMNALQDSDAYVRLNAAKELNRLDPPTAAKADVVSVLAGCTTNSSTDNEAVVALGDLHQEPDVAVPALIQCLQSPMSYVRENAAGALARFGEEAKSALPALTKTLGDPDSSVRLQAAAALRRINSGALPK